MIFPWKKITKIPWPHGGFPSHALTTGRAWSRSLLIELRGCLLALRQQGLADEDFPHGKNHGENHRFHWFQQENLGIYTEIYSKNPLLMMKFLVKIGRPSIRIVRRSEISKGTIRIEKIINLLISPMNKNGWVSGWLVVWVPVVWNLRILKERRNLSNKKYKKLNLFAS